MIFVCCYCFLTILILIYVCNIEDLKSGLNFSRSSGSDLHLGQEEREQPVGADWGYERCQVELLTRKAYLATITVLIRGSSSGGQVFN